MTTAAILLGQFNHLVVLKYTKIFFDRFLRSGIDLDIHRAQFIDRAFADPTDNDGIHLLPIQGINRAALSMRMIRIAIVQAGNQSDHKLYYLVLDLPPRENRLS
jgi:hypothetical protein